MEQRRRGAEAQTSPLLPRSPAPLQNSLLKCDGLVILLFLALTCVMTNPLVLHLANAVEDKQDALLNTWIIAWVGHALITDPLNLFNTNIFYPYPNTLAYSETMLPHGLFALPFNLAFDNTILGYNLVLLASFLLAAYAMYLFVFDLTHSRGAGIIAGTIFAFNPYNLGNLAQVQLLSFGWMPLAMLWLRKILTEDGRRKTKDAILSQFAIRNSLLFVFFFSLQALSSFYYAFLAGLGVALYIVWFFITHRAPHTTFYVSRFIRLAFSAVFIALIIIPFFIPYLQVQREMGFERKVNESEPFSASLKLFTEVSPQNVLYGNWLAPKELIYNGGYPLDNLFPGILAVALTIIGIVATKNRDRWFYFLLLAFAFVLSLGPRLFLAPNVPTDIVLPYRWLYDVFPLMKALRAPVRFDALVMFALAVLAGLGFPRITEHASRFTFYALRFTPLLIAFEYLALPAANITPVPVWNEIPEYVRWLRQQSPGVILELPMIASDPSQPLDLTTQYLSTYHWHATPDGYSGFNPPRRGEIAYEMRFMFDEPPIRLLQALDVQYIIFHDTESFPAANIQTDDVQFVRQFGKDSIYHISAHKQTADDLAFQLYLPQPAAPNQNYVAYIIVQNRGIHSFAIKPTARLAIQIRLNNQTIQTTGTLPLVTYRKTINPGVSIIPIHLAMPPNRGTLHLELQASLESHAWNLSGDVEVKNEEPAREVVLPVGVSTQTTFQSHYAAGEDVLIDLSWLAFGKIDAYYSASVRIIDAQGSKVTNVDREPAGRTFLWRAGNVIPDRFALTLPRDLAPGEYRVQVKMYQADQGIDALLLDEDFNPREFIELGKFTVK